MPLTPEEHAANLAEIERLQELLKSQDLPYDMAREIGELRAENERLRAEAGTLVQRIAEGVAENERLNELLRGVGANRYWEGRWRDEAAENERLLAALDHRGCAKALGDLLDENERLRAAGQNLIDEIREHGTHQCWKGLGKALGEQAKDSFPTESQRRMLDAAPGPRWPAEK
jgi:hypothetical protein